jgi:hypothetical protein
MAVNTQSFTDAWIAALAHERAACEAIFDDDSQDGPEGFSKSSGDIN